MVQDTIIDVFYYGTITVSPAFNSILVFILVPETISEYFIVTLFPSGFIGLLRIRSILSLFAHWVKPPASAIA